MAHLGGGGRAGTRPRRSFGAGVGIGAEEGEGGPRAASPASKKLAPHSPTNPVFQETTSARRTTGRVIQASVAKKV